MLPNIPRDRATLNAWFRSTTALNPVVNSTVDFHCNNIANNIVLSYKDTQYEELAQLVVGKLYDIVKEILVTGECFIYAELNQKDGMIDNFIIHNPDYIHVMRSSVADEALIFLRPDEHLRKTVFEETEEISKLSPEVIKCVKAGENIPLNPLYCTHLNRKMSPYDIRGTSFLMPVINYIAKDDMDNPEVKISIMWPFDKFGLSQRDRIEKFYLNIASLIINWLNEKVFQAVREQDWPVASFNCDNALSKLQTDTN